jgi:hypothetical protein
VSLAHLSSPRARSQHQHLLTLKDRAFEAKRSIQQAAFKLQSNAAMPTGGLSSTAGSAGAASKPMAGSLHFSASEQILDDAGGTLEGEKLELMRQDALLQKLVQTVKEAKDAGEQALALAQVAAGGV